VFCVDVEHASDMRQALIEENPELVAADPEWVVRIVGVEGEKERLLDDFTDPEAVSPAIATTSRLLSTGVDVQDLKYVVLFRPVGSMIEFKQIIGRGSRLYPDKGKHEFEIIDYVGASRLFEDPGFDGYPANIAIEVIDTSGEVTGTTAEPTGESDEGGQTEPADPVVNEPEPPFAITDPLPPPPTQPPRRKYYVDADDGAMRVESEARLVPTRASGRLQLTEYGQHVRDRIRAVGSDADTMRRDWASADSRHRLIAMLEGDGLDLTEIVEAVGVPGIDRLDALFHLAWDMPTHTRAQRARRVREAHAAELAAMTARARGILEGLLQRYETHGVGDIETPGVFLLDPLSQLGSPTELAAAAGGADKLRAHLDLVQQWLYA
jgi:type I restriction enzyme R subunit